MAIARFSCRVCKKKTNAKIVIEFSELLPPGLKCLECDQCGVLGIELNPEVVSDVE
jgi:hypothetical protein